MQEKKDYFLEIEKFSNVLFLLLLGAFIAICILMAWPFIKILGWAVALAIISYPIYSFLLRKIKSPVISAFLSCFIIIVVILIPAIFFITGVTEEAIN